VLNGNVLNELGIFDIDLCAYLKSNTNNVKKMVKDGYTVNNHVINTKIDDKDHFKIDYISNRTGIDFNNENIIKEHRVILNLNEFLTTNNVILDEDPNYIDEISKNSVGFATLDKNVLCMRNISSKRLDRYTLVKLDKTIHNPFLYIPPCSVNLLTKAPVMVLAEGAFDIICIKKRFYPKDCDNIIFSAVGTASGYKSAINKLLQLTCYFGCDITIYSDADIKLEVYKKTFEFNILKTNPIKVIYNKLHKDFGDVNEDYEFKSFYL
jgi:hypothetical protein